MFFQDKRIFVTGATGLVGGFLVEKLLSLGADVITLVRDFVPQSRFLSHLGLQKSTIIRGDLSDSRFLERILCEYEIQIVIHLAAQTIVPIANHSPLSTFESNIAGTWNLLEAARLSKHIKSIVVASSDKAYGDVPTLPYQEDMPLRAVYPYDVSKACTDMISLSYAKTFNLPVAITRCGNFFGGGDLNWNRVIPGTIRSIIRGERPIIRSNGKLIRDYIYVEDAVSAYLTLAEALFNTQNLMGEAFNFSNETQRTVLDLVHIILSSMGSSLEPLILNEASHEIEAQYLDSTKAQKILGWVPEFGLEEGLKRTLTWYTNFLKKE